MQTGKQSTVDACSWQPQTGGTSSLDCVHNPCLYKFGHVKKMPGSSAPVGCQQTVCPDPKCPLKAQCSAVKTGKCPQNPVTHRHSRAGQNKDYDCDQQVPMHGRYTAPCKAEQHITGCCTCHHDNYTTGHATLAHRTLAALAHHTWNGLHTPPTHSATSIPPANSTNKVTKI